MHRRRIIVGVAIVLYIVSLLLPAGCVVIKIPLGTRVGPDEPFRGYAAFFLTMVQPFKPSWEAAWLFGSWLANPIFWLGLFWYVKGRRGRAVAAGLLSLGLGLSVLPGTWDLIDGWPGYWVWLASFLTLFLVSLFDRRRVAGSGEVPNYSTRPVIAESNTASSAVPEITVCDSEANRPENCGWEKPGHRALARPSLSAEQMQIFTTKAPRHQERQRRSAESADQFPRVSEICR